MITLCSIIPHVMSRKYSCEKSAVRIGITTGKYGFAVEFGSWKDKWVNGKTCFFTVIFLFWHMTWFVIKEQK